MQELRLTGEDRIVCKVVYNDQDLKEFFVAPLLKEVCDFMLGIEDVCQGIGVVVIEIYWLLYGVLTFMPFSMYSLTGLQV